MPSFALFHRFRMKARKAWLIEWAEASDVLDSIVTASQLLVAARMLGIEEARHLPALSSPAFTPSLPASPLQPPAVSAKSMQLP